MHLKQVFDPFLVLRIEQRKSNWISPIAFHIFNTYQTMISTDIL